MIKFFINEILKVQSIYETLSWNPSNLKLTKRFYDDTFHVGSENSSQNFLCVCVCLLKALKKKKKKIDIYKFRNRKYVFFPDVYQ